jgi:hypothetical protein
MQKAITDAEIHRKLARHYDGEKDGWEAFLDRCRTSSGITKWHKWHGIWYEQSEFFSSRVNGNLRH